MRRFLPPGGRGRKVLSRVGRPLPAVIKRPVQDAVALWDHRREERTIAQMIEAREAALPEAPVSTPIPPPLLRVRVGGNPERAAWLAEGASDARLIREMLERNGAAMEEMGAVLDFGCGCGRVARHWAGLQGPEIHGVDVSRAAVRWCQRHLQFMETGRSEADPPLAYPSSRFGFVYALSVFTHLPEGATEKWLAELIRILRPGGFLLFTLHGERFIEDMDPAEAERFRRGEPVIVPRPTVLAGTNSFASFHPPAYVKDRLLPTVAVELVESVHQDPFSATWTPMIRQDAYLVRRRLSASR
jgi:SAM-dependent methyltransferase